MEGEIEKKSRIVSVVMNMFFGIIIAKPDNLVIKKTQASKRKPFFKTHMEKSSVVKKGADKYWKEKWQQIKTILLFQYI